ncbi:MAG TPA: hypothetical protein PKZ92_00345 [Candidatus Woesebacteria bacterium]|jgi:hypothetical protein|nr:hypothetical protein [Candidatus Shapirobacteria bacterium]HOR01703.1 hypothetical protein [Candidatus Woesebacteria bacterium]
MGLALNYCQQRLISCLVWIILIGSVVVVLIAIIWLIIKRLRILSDLERDLNKRLVIVKSGQCLSVQDAIILEKDLNSLLNLFEESYKIDKNPKLKDRFLNWNNIHLNLQKYLRKEINFSELKCLI